MSRESTTLSDLGHLKLNFEHEGRVARLTLNAPRANVIDLDMMSSLRHAFTLLETRARLRAVVLDAAGPHFSFGASIAEHLPEHVETTLQQLHDLLRLLQKAVAPTIAVVQGRCLGGGLELALACDLILADENAVLACPEIQLGVFAPAASTLLPLRIGSGRAAQSLLTGAEWKGSDALGIGLIDRAAPEGTLESVLQAWLEHDFLPRSAAGLKHAAHANRWQKTQALDDVLPQLERMYVDKLTREPDGFEGIRAFIEKRQPRWHDERGE